MAVKLTVSSRAGGEPVDLTFDQERVRIGRGAACDLRIPDDSVSTVHALVILDGDSYFLLDQGSTNGTTLNGAAVVVDRRKLLRSGDRIGIAGFDVEFRAGVAMASAHSGERTLTAARRLVQGLLTSERLELRRPALIVLNGPQAGERFELPTPPARLAIGRATECEIALVDGDASRRHAEVEMTAAGATIRDLGSKNRLLVNDREVAEHRLRDRDEILVGSTRLAYDEPVEAYLRELAELPESGTVRAARRAPAEPEPTEEDGDLANEERTTEEPIADRSLQLATATGRKLADAVAATARAARAGASAYRDRSGSAGSEIAVLVVGALALAICVAALVWIFR